MVGAGGGGRDTRHRNGHWSLGCPSQWSLTNGVLFDFLLLFDLILGGAMSNKDDS